MGDGIDPFLRGAVGAVGTGLVGLLHGIGDSTSYGHELPQLGHYVVDYLPPVSAGLGVATSKYGLYSTKSRIGAGVVGGGVSAVTALIGYGIGRIAAEGTKKILY